MNDGMNVSSWIFHQKMWPWYANFSGHFSSPNVKCHDWKIVLIWWMHSKFAKTYLQTLFQQRFFSNRNSPKCSHFHRKYQNPWYFDIIKEGVTATELGTYHQKFWKTATFQFSMILPDICNSVQMSAGAITSSESKLLWVILFWGMVPPVWVHLTKMSDDQDNEFFRCTEINDFKLNYISNKSFKNWFLIDVNWILARTFYTSGNLFLKLKLFSGPIFKEQQMM